MENGIEWGLNFTHSSEWGWMDSARILFIPIRPHSSPFLHICIRNCCTKALSPYYWVYNSFYNLSLSWVTDTFDVFNLVDTFLQVPTNVDEWGWMGRTRILSIPFHPHSDEWMEFNPHSSPFPIHPTCPVKETLKSLVASKFVVAHWKSLLIATKGYVYSNFLFNPSYYFPLEG